MKKIIKIIGILVCLMVLFLNLSLNRTNSPGHTDLSKLIVVNEANAECASWQWYMPHAKCLVMNQECVEAVDYEECDPSK
jgi:hypothetical protein